MIDLMDLISFEGFHFARATYRDQEIEILQPRLEALGYSEIKWYDGERDSFGPLIRKCSATDPDGKSVELFYG